MQPDGSIFRLQLYGDEYFSWHETEDGYAVRLRIKAPETRIFELRRR